MIFYNKHKLSNLDVTYYYIFSQYLILLPARLQKEKIPVVIFNYVHVQIGSSIFAFAVTRAVGADQ